MPRKERKPPEWKTIRAAKLRESDVLKADKGGREFNDIMSIDRPTEADPNRMVVHHSGLRHHYHVREKVVVWR